MFDRADLIFARLKAPLRLAVATLLLWAGAEALLYRSGAYYAITEIESNTGAVVNALHLLEREHRADARNVLVFGDSRIGEGFSAKLAEGGRDDINYVNLSVPGSTPRTWYYLLRAVNDAGYRYDAVLIGTVYRPQATQKLADWPLDPMHHAPLLRLRDWRDYPSGFLSDTMRERARHAVLFPALAMRQDTLAALAAPRQRWHQVFTLRPGFLAAVVDYAGRDARMPALAFEGTRAVRDWGDADATQRALVEGHLTELAAVPAPDVQQANDAYFAHWFGAIAALAGDAPAGTLLFALPRGPYGELQPPPREPPSALTAHASVRTLPPQRFADLERPEFFFDVLHLNRAGRERMSQRLGDDVRALLGDGAR